MKTNKQKILTWSLYLLFPLILSGLAIACYASFQFYYLFPNSTDLFRFRHKHFSHLEIHTDKWSFKPGDSLNVYISAKGISQVEIVLFDILHKDSLIHQPSVAVEFQEVHDSVSIAGTGWKPSLTLSIPPKAKSGWYVLAISAKDRQRATSIFITPLDSIKKPIALLLSTNTWNAYNFWGGQSLYSLNKTHTVSFNRPQLLADPFLPNTYVNHQIFYQSAQRDRSVARFIDSLQLGLDAYPMEELQTSTSRLQHYPILIISTHSEYWTREMMAHLNEYLMQGGSLLCLSGNTAAYVSHLRQLNRKLTVYKKEENLWLHADTAHIKPFGTENNLSSFHTYAPYRILVDTSWVLAGTQLQKGDLIGKMSETYDYTYMFDNWLNNLLGLLNRGKMGAASGLEVDQINAFTPDNWISIARGLNPDHVGYGEVYPDKWQWDAKGGADMGYYIHPGGGLVFNVSSMAFTGAIPHDSMIRQILANLLDQILKKQ